jgi:hypothetical protein
MEMSQVLIDQRGQWIGQPDKLHGADRERAEKVHNAWLAVEACTTAIGKLRAAIRETVARKAKIAAILTQTRPSAHRLIGDLRR